MTLFAHSDEKPPGMAVLQCALPNIPRNGHALQRQLLQTDSEDIAMIRKIVLAAMVSAAFGSITLPADAATIVRIAPPPPRTEAVPSPRRGYVWVAGHWGWKNRHHQWIKGTWIRERRGYQYNQPTWVERDGRWHMESGNWRRADRDGDGVPNRQDRAPNNPNRY